MYTTIGEIVNEIAPYSIHMELGITGNLPYLKGFLDDGRGLTNIYVYVVQTSPYVYDIIESNDDSLAGDRYIPTGNKSESIIRESEWIQAWLHKKVIKEKMLSRNLSRIGVVSYLCELLIFYKLTKVRKATLDLGLRELKFPSIRIYKTLESIYNFNKSQDISVRDFIYMSIPVLPITLGKSLKDKDIKDLLSKFRDRGIILQMEDRDIIRILFEKRYDRTKIPLGSNDRV